MSFQVHREIVLDGECLEADVAAERASLCMSLKVTGQIANLRKRLAA